MASVSFLLKRAGEEITTVQAMVYWPGARTKVYTDVKVQTAHWNKGDQRVFKKHPGATLINDTLDLMAEQLLTCYEACRAAGLVPTKEQLQESIAPRQAEVVPEVTTIPGVEAAYQAWLDHKLTLAHTTRLSRQTTLRHLLGWQQAARGRQLAWSSFTDAFLNSFVEHLVSARNLADSAINKSVGILKAFLRWAEGHGYPTGRAYQKYRWKNMEPAIVTLTPDELARIEQLVLPAGGYLDNARGLFLLGCYTGLRFSDVAALRKEQISGDKLRVTTKKTKDELVIHIRPQLRPLLDAVRAGTLRPIENQVLNRYLKELGQLAGLTDRVPVNRFQLGQRTSESKEKWEVLTTHTARRTFITDALARGMRREVVMAVSGHSDYKSFKRYVNVTATDVLNEFEKFYGQSVSIGQKPE